MFTCAPAPPPTAHTAHPERAAGRGVGAGRVLAAGDPHIRHRQCGCLSVRPSRRRSWRAGHICKSARASGGGGLRRVGTGRQQAAAGEPSLLEALRNELPHLSAPPGPARPLQPARALGKPTGGLGRRAGRSWLTSSALQSREKLRGCPRRSVRLPAAACARLFDARVLSRVHRHQRTAQCDRGSRAALERRRLGTRLKLPLTWRRRRAESAGCRRVHPPWT